MIKNLLVTGASGGIGNAVVLLAAQAGFNIAIHYHRNYQSALILCKQIQKFAVKTVIVHANISRQREVSQMFDKCEKTIGKISHLVNNAGIVGFKTSFLNITSSEFVKVFKVNVLGTFYCCQEYIKRLTEIYLQQDYAIVNVSSQAAIHGSPNEWIHYAASKGAVSSFTTGLAKEVAPLGIRVNVISPGLIDTEIHKKAGVPDRLKNIKQFVPIGRAGTPKEVAELILFLLSESASYITNSNITIGGGR